MSRTVGPPPIAYEQFYQSFEIRYRLLQKLYTTQFKVEGFTSTINTQDSYSSLNLQNIDIQLLKEKYL